MSKTYDVQFTLTQRQFEEMLTEAGNACLAGKHWVKLHGALIEAKHAADARDAQSCHAHSSSGTPCRGGARHRGVHVGTANNGASVWWEEDSASWQESAE